MDKEFWGLLERSQKTMKRQISIALLVAVVCFAFFYLKVNPLELFQALPDFVTFFYENFLPPNFKNIGTYVPLIIQTLLFAVVATYISAFLAFMLGLLMSEETNPFGLLRLIVRFLISFMRNVPVLVWASLLVYIFGIGDLVGLIALVIATLGFLSRSYAESISEITGTKLESLKASGASYLQVIFHGLIPEFIPSWINWTLFSFEINIRASVILGMVGAGGIGIMIQTNIRLFKYREALSLIMVLVMLVLMTEFLTNNIRKRVAGDLNGK